MIGLVIVTHGDLAIEFRKALEHVVGEQTLLETICIAADDDMEVRRNDIEAALKRVDQGNGVILLTDLFGGTPSNMAISLMQESNVEVIAGINLPMLVKLAGVRKTHSIEEACQISQEAGRKYIQIASTLLEGSK
ncbi:MAG: PTS sugar transporter subunit IIA [Rhizobiaceae bacterium]|nr:PTS sugar transporter subunit IIA [Rhizobiaceae bacterium]